jgi:hypothetical protein
MLRKLRLAKCPLFCLALLVLFAGSCDVYNTPVKDKIDLSLIMIPVYTWNELIAVINTAPDGAIIGIMQNMNAMPSITVNSDKTVTLAAFKEEVVISRIVTSSALFTVTSTTTLILGDSRGGTLILDGESAAGVNSALVSVSSAGGSLTLNEGAVLRNNITTGDGGGVNFANGTFTMNGGTISGNSASEGGGVYMSGGALTFKKTGGTIYGYIGTNNTSHEPSENTATSGNGHAVYFSGTQKRNSTARPDVVLDSAITGAAGGWE